MKKLKIFFINSKIFFNIRDFNIAHSVVNFYCELTKVSKINLLHVFPNFILVNIFLEQTIL